VKIKIGIIGGGNIGGAIAGGIRKKYAVAVCEQDAKRRRALKRKYNVATGSLQDVMAASAVVILAVKPQDFDRLLRKVRPLLKNQLIVSIAAGITCRYVEKNLGAKARVVRAMPNLPAQVGEGVAGICAGKAAKQKDLILAQRLFSCVGATVVVEEKLMDAITAASGSGPAYVFLFIESLEKAVRSLGLGKDLSKALVRQTIKGGLDLLDGQKEDASTLRARVTSKGGTTQAAMDVFKKRGLDNIFKAALSAAKKRARELSR